MFPKKTSFMVRSSYTTPDITPLDSASQRSASLDLRLNHYVPDEPL